MLLLLKNPLMRWGLSIAVVAAILGGTYLKGYFNGRSSVLEKAQKELSEQLEERGTTDEEIADMSDADKCELIGGVWNSGLCE